MTWLSGHNVPYVAKHLEWRFPAFKLRLGARVKHCYRTRCVASANIRKDAIPSPFLRPSNYTRRSVLCGSKLRPYPTRKLPGIDLPPWRSMYQPQGFQFNGSPKQRLRGKHMNIDHAMFHFQSLANKVALAATEHEQRQNKSLPNRCQEHRTSTAQNSNLFPFVASHPRPTPFLGGCPTFSS